MSVKQKEYDLMRTKLAEKIFLIHYQAYIDQEANKYPLDEIITSTANPLIFRMVETARDLAKGVTAHITSGFVDPADDPFL